MDDWKQKKKAAMPMPPKLKERAKRHCNQESASETFCPFSVHIRQRGVPLHWHFGFIYDEILPNYGVHNSESRPAVLSVFGIAFLRHTEVTTNTIASRIIIIQSMALAIKCEHNHITYKEYGS
jgi:hypothetical protein